MRGVFFSKIITMCLADFFFQFPLSVCEVYFANGYDVTIQGTLRHASGISLRQ
jgi:hypothetical protein